MVDISKLLCGQNAYGDQLRYSESSHRRPVVVWNTTQRCNLRCVHCYASAGDGHYPGELTTAEGRALIEDLAQYGAPVLLFSGGEPTMREDLVELLTLATARGLRAVISTNGTLITPDMARDMKRAGVVYVGVSLDGVGETHDRFRGKKGAFQEALSGLANAREAGLRTGIRFTITRFNNSYVAEIFRLLEEEAIDRLCLYHLVYAGRGSHLVSWDLTPEERRTTMDLILDRTADLHRRGLDKDILTVDNHADGIYLYLKVARKDPRRAQEVYSLLERNGGNSSGLGISAVDALGRVHPDQFWGHYDLGSIRERPFSQIWKDTSDPLLAGLRDRKGRIGGRCAGCRHFAVCGGNFRVRAEAMHGDVWAADPACYLTDEEIGVA
ncbi:MAG: radical SAM protein [Dehalococcoidia bacterium]|nr:radical SAM protein [Dehalococcoidia bacterium]